jgi:hypothetical protein
LASKVTDKLMRCGVKSEVRPAGFAWKAVFDQRVCHFNYYNLRRLVAVVA